MRRWLSFIFALLAASALGHAPEPKLFFPHGVNNLTNVFTLNPQPATNDYSHDAYDRMFSHTNADGYVIQYRYDQNGNLTNLIYPGNRTVTYSYDSLNRLTNVTDWANRKTTFEYDLASRVRKITRPNGTIRELHYDDAGQTTNIVEKMAIGVPIAFFKLNWNDAGRMAWEFAAPLPHSNAPPSRTMHFDADNRMTNFNGQIVTYDPDGNMTYGPLTNNTLVTHTYDARNRLLSAGGLSYGYDPAGNRTSITNGANVTRLVVNPNAALSQVLMRVRPGVTNYYIYGLGLLYEITETATSTNTATYHYDYRGSTVALTDGNGIPTDRIEYSTYATTTYRTGTNDTPFLFNGRYGVQTDPNGLLHMRARYYNPHLCRFLNADPSGFSGGLNFYAYADGNPVSMMDPFGLGAGGEGFWSWLGNKVNSLFDGSGNGLYGLPSGGQMAHAAIDNFVSSFMPSAPPEVQRPMAYNFGSYDPQSSVPTWADIATITAGVMLGLPADSPGAVPRGPGGGMTTLYRSVSHAEYADVTASGVLRPGPNSYEFGKFFAESGEHAAQWGTRLEGAGNFRVIEAQFPSSTASQFMRFDNPILDNIGPARFGRFEQLGQPTIRLWPGSP